MDHNFWEKIYCQAPLWLQNVMTSAKGMQFRYQRGSDKILHEKFYFLLESQYWTYDQIRDYQVQQLRQLLQIAFNHVPYYRDLRRDLKCNIEDFKEPEDIRLLPTLRKSQVRGNESLFLDQRIDLKNCHKGSTSGTTGTPIIVYGDKESFSRKWAFVCRLRHWAGLRNPFYPKRAQFTARHIVPYNQSPETRVYWRYNLPGRSLLCSTANISPEAVPFYVKALQDFNPELIDGMPSSMLVLARVNRRLGLHLPKPKAMITTAETLLPEHRQELQETFGCKVFNQYSATDPSCFWCDCEYGVMHDNPESGISEILDENDKPVQNGTVGEVAFTPFSRVMIFIRYKLGDLAVKDSQRLCLCGRNMPIIKNLHGRKDDILYVPDRGYIPDTSVFSGLSNIIEGQVIQENFDHIRVLLVPDEGYNQEVESRLINNLRFQISSSINITIEKVEKVPRGAGGKFRSIITKIGHLYPDDMSLY
jgi:phenylacetate-CoA ligase